MNLEDFARWLEARGVVAEHARTYRSVAASFLAAPGAARDLREAIAAAVAKEEAANASPRRLANLQKVGEALLEYAGQVGYSGAAAPVAGTPGAHGSAPLGGVGPASGVGPPHASAQQGQGSARAAGSPPGASTATPAPSTPRAKGPAPASAGNQIRCHGCGVTQPFASGGNCAHCGKPFPVFVSGADAEASSAKGAVPMLGARPCARCGGPVILDDRRKQAGPAGAVTMVLAVGAGMLCGFLGALAGGLTLAGGGALAAAFSLRYRCASCGLPLPESRLTPQESEAHSQHRVRLLAGGAAMLGGGALLGLLWLYFLSRSPRAS